MTKEALSLKEGIAQTKEFIKKYGFGYVPTNIIDAKHNKLALWQGVRRMLHYNGNLSEDEFKKLPDIHIEAFASSWSTWYRMLYRAVTEAKNGEYVSLNSSDHSDLGKWYRSQYTNYKNGALDPEKIALLKKLKFRFLFKSESDLAFERKCEELKAFKKKFGHARVSSGTKGYEALGRWVSRIRYYKRNLHKHPRALTPERIQLCEEAGIIWDPYA